MGVTVAAFQKIEEVRHAVRTERWSIRRVQCGRPGRAVGTTWRLEVMGGAEALHEVGHIEIDVGVPSRNGVVEDPGFGRADRGRVRGFPAGTGGGRAAPGRGRDPDGSVCLVVKTREKKSSVSSVRAPRRPLHQPRRRVLLSLCAHLCIRYLPMWYWCGALHGMLCMRPSLAGWDSCSPRHRYHNW